VTTSNQVSELEVSELEAGTAADVPKSLAEIGEEDMGATATGEAVAFSHAHLPPVGRYRWTICALLFFATTINYVDRQVLGILKPLLSQDLGWNELEYGNIVMAFQLAYAIGLLASGALIDRLGTRLGYAASLIVWSLAAMGHALVHSVAGFSVARFALGLGEAGNFPAATKTVAEWFPKRERALAFGIFNAGSNVGAIITPLVVPFIAVHYGWRWAFIGTGAIGFIWLLFWLPIYRRPEDHKKVSAAELAYIRSDAAETETKIPWRRVFPLRQTWAVAIAKLLTDPVWWFYLFWLADFLKKEYGLSMTQLSLPLIVIYLVADVGSIGGGWLSSTLIKRGKSVNVARKTAMLICALCVLPVSFAVMTSHLWVAVGLISLAAAAHQGWSANVYTLASDMFPRRAVGSVIGIAGMAGALGGLGFSGIVSRILEYTNSNYVPIFMVCGGAYLAALGIVHLLVPQLAPPDLEDLGQEGEAA
jgi:ACS family hexuronate transporter-like MFS transporter